MGEPERTTTLQIYAADSDWFRAWQRKISAREGRWMNIPEAVRALITELEAQGDGA